jgi:glycosyltransferase involved in cell wall biosynthesis
MVERNEISVIIPTYNRPQTLLQALRSLQEQTRSDFELIVVDNAANPEVRRMIGEFNRTARISVHYIADDSGGNSGARNRAAREAKGKLLVYTDDDLTFDPRWIEAYGTHFSAHPEMIAAGGCVKPAWEESPPEWLLEYMGKSKVFGILALMEPAPHFTLSEKGFFFSCNMAIRRSVFDWTGFRPEMYGTRTIGNGEAGLNQEISRRGGLIGYIPDAIVYHHIPQHRMKVDYIRKWAWHQGGSEMYARWWNRKRSVASLTGEAIYIALRYGRPWVKDFLVRHRRDPAAVDAQFRASVGWCKLNYVWWMLTDPQVQAALDMTDFRL